MRKNIYLLLFSSCLFFIACEEQPTQTALEKAAFTELLNSSFKKNNIILDKYIKTYLFSIKRELDGNSNARPAYELAKSLVADVEILESSIQDMNKELSAIAESSTEPNSFMDKEERVQKLEKQIDDFHNSMLEQVAKLFGKDASESLKPERSTMEHV